METVDEVLSRIEQQQVKPNLPDNITALQLLQMIRLVAQQRFPEHRRQQIVEEEEELSTKARTAPHRLIKRQDTVVHRRPCRCREGRRSRNGDDRLAPG